MLKLTHLQSVFLLDPDDPEGTGKPGGDVIRGLEDGSPQQGPGAEPLDHAGG